MKKIFFIPLLFLALLSKSQTIDTLLSINGKLKKDTATTIIGNYIKTPTSTSFYFDSTLVVTNVTLNGTGDSLYLYKGEVIVSRMAIGSTSSGSWSTTGNTGLTAPTNFLGTSDNTDLVFKRNDTSVARFWPLSSISLGRLAGDGITASTSDIIAIGRFSGTGMSPSASQSTFIGVSAGQSVGSGTVNVNFLGYQAGYSSNVTLSNFLGYQAGYSATNASNSNFLGNFAGKSATGASNCNFLGASAGLSASAVTFSNYLGANAGSGATNASFSNFIGRMAGQNATNASNSTFLGPFTGDGATGASFSFFAGYTVGRYTTYALTGSNNIMIGTNITLPSASLSNSINFGNVFYGTNTYSTTTGNPQTAAQINGHIAINHSTPDTSAVLDLTGYKYGFLPPRMTSWWRKSINTGVASGTKTNGSLYTSGTYNNVSLTGGSGTGAIATIGVSGGQITSVTITTAGINYQVGDVLSANTSDIGGTGSGFTYTITALQYAAKGLSVYDSTINLPTVYTGNRNWAKIPMTMASVDTAAQTTAITLTTLTSDVSNSTYDIGGYINPTAIATDVIQLQCTYTDQNSNSQTVSWSNISAVGNSAYSPVTIRVKGGTTITLKTNLSTGGGTITYDAGGYIKKDY